MGPVVVVDDDRTTLGLMRLWLGSAGYRSVEFERGLQVLAELPAEPSVVCLDLGLEDMPGLHVLQHLQANHPDLPVIVITARGDLGSAVESMRAGAYDYLVKPLSRAQLLDSVQRAVARRQQAIEVKRAQSLVSSGGILGNSAPVQELLRQIERVRGSDVTVFINGESGTGKELVARALHETSRSRGPFVALNCASIPASLQESELFGHERGSFSGAVGVQRGRFEQADKGTLFLDELGEMSPPVQAALLRALQERKIRRIGGAAEIPIDVRVVSATHRDLEAEVRAGRFREDLYFRLVVYPIRVPPLRERRDDIPLLVGHFLQKLGADMHRGICRIHPNALNALIHYGWPGNIRELQNTIHRAILACDDAELRLEHLPPSIRTVSLPEVPAAAPPPPEEPVMTLQEAERRAIMRALQATKGNVAQAARLLGIGRATLYRRLAALELPHGASS